MSQPARKRLPIPYIGERSELSLKVISLQISQFANQIELGGQIVEPLSLRVDGAFAQMRPSANDSDSIECGWRTTATQAEIANGMTIMKHKNGTATVAVESVVESTLEAQAKLAELLIADDRAYYVRQRAAFASVVADADKSKIIQLLAERFGLKNVVVAPPNKPGRWQAGYVQCWYDESWEKFSREVMEPVLGGPTAAWFADIRRTSGVTASSPNSGNNPNANSSLFGGVQCKAMGTLPIGLRFAPIGNAGSKQKQANNGLLSEAELAAARAADEARAADIAALKRSLGLV